MATNGTGSGLVVTPGPTARSAALTYAVRAGVALLAAALVACGGRTAAPEDLILLPTPAGPGSGEASLSATADGRVRMSWLEPRGEGVYALRMATLEDTTWSAAQTIATSNDFLVNWADFPSVIELPAGRLAAHWLQRGDADSHAYDIVVAQSTDGGASWSAGVRPHRDGTATEHGFVSLFPWADDALAAVWLDGRNFAAAAADPALEEEMTLRFATLDAAGRLAHEAELDGRTCDCCQTAVGLTGRGPIVAYRDRTADEVRDIYLVRYVDGAWSEPAPAHRDQWVIDACPVNGPALDARGDHVVLAWYTAASAPETPDEPVPAVYIAFSEDAGASFGAPIRVDDGQPVGRVDVVLLDDDALVTWLEGTGDRAGVRARRVARDAAGAAWTVAPSSAARASGFPRLARTADRVVYAWTDPNRGVRAASQRIEDLP